MSKSRIRKSFEISTRVALKSAKTLNRRVDYSGEFGSYRAWADGSVSRLDAVGDSVEVVIPTPDTKITVTATPALMHALRERLSGGLHGRTLQEVAERLLCEAVR